MSTWIHIVLMPDPQAGSTFLLLCQGSYLCIISNWKLTFSKCQHTSPSLRLPAIYIESVAPQLGYCVKFFYSLRTYFPGKTHLLIFKAVTDNWQIYLDKHCSLSFNSSPGDSRILSFLLMTLYLQVNCKHTESWHCLKLAWVCLPKYIFLKWKASCKDDWKKVRVPSF